MNEHTPKIESHDGPHISTRRQVLLALPAALPGAYASRSAQAAPPRTAGAATAGAAEQEMVVRISEIEIDASFLEAYKAILKAEAEASVRLEPGVISIFPMYQKDEPTEIRILEIYAGREAYESHLKTPHFQEYKTSTFKMVKSLELVDMKAMDPATMTTIFRKMKR